MCDPDWAFDEGKYAALEQACADAENLLRGRVRYTAVLEANLQDLILPTEELINSQWKPQVNLKLETQQLSGSFKIRGALNAVLQLPQNSLVIAHSSGNHGAAVALAARMHGCEATIVVPFGAPRCKTDLVQQFGARLEFCENSMKAREEMAEALCRVHPNAYLIPPFNDERVIAGQSTIGAEFVRQVPDLDAIVVPVSGGGMISGIALVVKRMNPRIKVYAAEPCGATGDHADVFNLHRRAGALESWDRNSFVSPDTIADGLRATPGSLTWPIINDLVDTVIVVSEGEILQAMRICFEQLKLVVEPSSAVGVAALRKIALSAKSSTENPLGHSRRVGVVLCGANVDLSSVWSNLDGGQSLH